MARLFFSYSHKDEGLRDELEVHLSMMKRQGLIETWHDRRIAAGDELDKAIDSELEAADVILLLVSPDFLASEYCYGIEMRRTMERHEAGEARVIPVILRPCDWTPAPFGKLMATPTDGKAVTKWPDKDDAFLAVAKAIRAALAELPSKDASSRSASAAPDTETASRADKPRSGNLRVIKTFTDRDRDNFLHESFGFIARYFENSLTELAERNPGIETSFRQLDANRFTAAIYRDGDKVSGCTIYIGSGWMDSNSISLSLSDNGRTGQYNENLSVDVDEQSMHLMAAGMTVGLIRESQKLTMEGGAELFWSLLMEPVQRS